MELEEQSGVDTCKGDSEKICWPLVQAGRLPAGGSGDRGSTVRGKREREFFFGGAFVWLFWGAWAKKSFEESVKE